MQINVWHDQNIHNSGKSHIYNYIFQNFNLLDEYTVLDNVLMPAKIARKGNQEMEAKFPVRNKFWYGF